MKRFIRRVLLSSCVVVTPIGAAIAQVTALPGTSGTETVTLEGGT